MAWFWIWSFAVSIRGSSTLIFQNFRKISHILNRVIYNLRMVWVRSFTEWRRQMWQMWMWMYFTRYPNTKYIFRSINNLKIYKTFHGKWRRCNNRPISTVVAFLPIQRFSIIIFSQIYRWDFRPEFKLAQPYLLSKSLSSRPKIQKQLYTISKS